MGYTFADLFGTDTSKRGQRFLALRISSAWKQSAFALAFAVLLGPQQISAQSTQANCSDSLFSTSAGCQTTTQQTQQNTYGQSAPSNGSIQPIDIPLTSRQPDNSQVYIDSAGNQWQRLTAQNDRNRSTSLFPPDPVTDLQKLARSSSGEIIPVFGRDFFQHAPSTFAPADDIPATSDYVVGPGDVILVRLWGGGEASSGNSQLTVDTSGNIYIPRVGAIRVAGLKANELQDRITAEVNHIFRNYRISVSLGHLRSIQVYVVGEARQPAAYTISALSTLINALFASGGPNVQGSVRHIQVRRGSQTLPEFDLYDLVLKGDKSRDIHLESGDIIYIPPVGPQVALAGSVRHPAIYELKSTSTLGDVLALAGGFSATAASSQIRLERIQPDLERKAVTVNLDDAGRAMLMRDGDVLYAGHISAGYEQSVTIRGNLANPGRFAWKQGMRLSDILPDRRSLLTNNYWRERNKLGVPVPLFEPSEFNDQQYPLQPNRNNQRTVPNNSLTSQGYGASANSLNNNVLSKGQVSTSDALSSVQPPDAEGDEQQAGLAVGGVIAAENDSDSSGASGADPTRPMTNSENPQDMRRSPRTRANVVGTEINRVRIPAPEIDWSYAVIERLDPNTLKSVLIPFNLGKLVQDHDQSQNLELQAGDIVTILSQHDIIVPQHEQTKFVRLEGEFAGAGVYSVGPDETLDQLVSRAGGFTSRAYLFGSSFQRESARVFQQQRLNEYITQLSADMQRETAVRAASSSTGISDPNALLEERGVVQQLRQMRATGRIVLEFQPNSAGLDHVPHIPLENGDVFRVPAKPDTVSVIGAVYGQNVFLYDSHRHLEDYLALAGKPNRVADRKHAFIIRANGSVFSRELTKGVFSNHFDESRIFPGDSIVIPEKLIKPTTLKQLTDYSQILSSFGLAAAAINVVR